MQGKVGSGVNSNSKILPTMASGRTQGPVVAPCSETGKWRIVCSRVSQHAAIEIRPRSNSSGNALRRDAMLQLEYPRRAPSVVARRSSNDIRIAVA
jgi:hypothetical protein